MRLFVLALACVLVVSATLVLEYVLAGLGFVAHINVRWVEREVFLASYGIDAAAGERTNVAGNLPSCFQEGLARPATFDASAAACGIVKIASAPTESQPPACNPLVVYDYQARTWPFTPYRIQTLVVAAGAERGESLPQALITARTLDRGEFGSKYSPNFALSKDDDRLQEMLVYDDADPEVTAVDCGDHAILGITFDPGSLRR